MIVYKLFANSFDPLGGQYYFGIISPE